MQVSKQIKFQIFLYFFLFLFTSGYSQIEGAKDSLSIGGGVDSAQTIGSKVNEGATSQDILLRDTLQEPKQFVQNDKPAQLLPGISGTLLDSLNGEPLIGASVLIEGRNLGASTDLEGFFEIPNVSDGQYTLKISYLGYKSRSVNTIVKNGKSPKLSLSMPPDVNTLQEVQVVGVRRTNTEAAVIQEVKNSEQVVSAISSEQIAKSQDRDAAQVIQRIPGVTIIDNRFVMVRGLSERYNAVMLNGAFTPSTEVDARAFSFDIVPSGMIDRLLIYKSGAPELPGDFAGAAIKIVTKTVTNENFTTFGLSSSYRANTTFKEFKSNAVGKYEFIGFGDGSRDLPKNFPTTLVGSTASESVAAGKSLNNDYKINSFSALPDLRANFNMSRRFNVGGKRLGFILGVNYTNANMQLRPVQYRREGYVPEANMSAIRVENFDRAFVNNVRLGIINNYSFEINPNNKIYFKNVFNHIGMRETILREGNYYMEESTFKSYSFRYETRSIYSGQLQGSHDITPMTNLTWTLGSSNTLRKEPDTRRMRYIRNEANSPDFQAAIPRGATNTEASRFFSNLSESAKMASVDLEQNIRIVKGEENVKKHLKLRTGFYLENKQRDFSARWMSFAYGSKKFNNEISTQPIEEIFKAENIDSVTGLVLKEGTNPSDKYDAANKLAAGYIGVSLPLNNLNISTGVRVENNVQSINSANTSKEPINAKFPITSILPSANISYNLTDKWLIRAAYFKSVNRPEFRELAPFSYYDFNFLGGSDIIGNPNLKIATIDNADLRLEFYPSENESISIGGFYKKFKNPIERYVLVGSNPVFTFNNAISSESYGVELEMRKSLNFISQTSIIKNFSLLLNTSLINSKIKNDLSLDSSQVSQRLMQGQSPYIVNAGIYFNDSDKKVQFNLLYNVFGERLFAVGNSEIESIFELPRNILDATLTKGFGDHWEFRFGIQDILNQAVRFKQDSDQDLKLTSKDEYVNSFKRGSYFTFGVNYKL